MTDLMREGLSLTAGVLRRADGARFDPRGLAWQAAPPPPAGQAIEVIEAAAWVLHHGGPRLPVAIIGPREPTQGARDAAAAVAARLARIGFPLICGGRAGVMEDASRAAAGAGGLMIGLLPSADWREANPHVGVPIATGLGEARNAVIAAAGFALVACGGSAKPVSYGTISEMAFGLRLGRRVIGMPEAPDLPGVLRCATAEEAAAHVAARYLALE